MKDMRKLNASFYTAIEAGCKPTHGKIIVVICQYHMFVACIHLQLSFTKCD